MIAERIKFLREQNGMTQTELAKKLSITRSSVNAWEMGISVPSTQFIVELAGIFKVSTDYLLNVGSTISLPADGLEEEDIRVVYQIIEHIKNKNEKLKH